MTPERSISDTTPINLKIAITAVVLAASGAGATYWFADTAKNEIRDTMAQQLSSHSALMAAKLETQSVLWSTLQTDVRDLSDQQRELSQRIRELEQKVGK